MCCFETLLRCESITFFTALSRVQHSSHSCLDFHDLFTTSNDRSCVIVSPVSARWAQVELFWTRRRKHYGSCLFSCVHKKDFFSLTVSLLSWSIKPSLNPPGLTLLSSPPTRAQNEWMNNRERRLGSFAFVRFSLSFFADPLVTRTRKIPVDFNSPAILPRAA